MTMLHHPARFAAIAISGLGMTAMASSLGGAVAAAAPPGAPALSMLENSLPITTDNVIGGYSSSRMSVEIALAPRNQAELDEQLRAAYSSHGKAYQHWLAQGQFDRRYAPRPAERGAITSYLHAAGLAVQASASPFLVRAAGSSKLVAAAFHTRLSTYRDGRGTRYFSNSVPVRLPSRLARGVLGVIGLSDTVRERSMIMRAANTGDRAARPAGSSASCETPYVTAQQLFSSANGAGFPYGFGGGPGCNGMTPSQINSIYGAPQAGPRGEGAGVSMAVFELSAYQHSDIDTWARTFYGPRYDPPLTDISVDGGPLHPACPAGDTCPPTSNSYSGDVEVDADIEMSLAVSPDARHLMVYNAPADLTGQTSLDEFTAIADDDQASVVSSSWSVCENDVSAGYVQAENIIFEQMALQGQSMFGAAGDTGAFSCIRSDGTDIVNVLDPPSQPWVTSVGGTSLESANPGTNPRPRYPAGVETVWNVDSLCNAGASEGGQTGFFWCAESGAGGGGSSQWWGRPADQSGPGVNNPYTTRGNGTTQCALARRGTPCREDPDISADADEYTPYAEFCTGNPDPPDYSTCGTFSGSQVPPGWFGIGGTSLSSPLWSAIIADRDGYLGHRAGNVNSLLYLVNTLTPGRYLHDITGLGQTTDNNGLFPTTPGYDESTGLGTPKMAALITGS